MTDVAEFEVGAAVRLRVDGSPNMVVEAIEEDGRLLCSWEDGAGNRKSQAFPPRSLRAVDPGPVNSAAGEGPKPAPPPTSS